MRFYRRLVRKWCEILGNYCWLITLRKLRETIDNHSWLVRKLREIIDNYSWLVRNLREILENYNQRALLGGRLPRPHFLDLDRAPGNGHFLLQFVFKTDLKPVLVTLGPFGIHLMVWQSKFAFSLRIPSDSCESDASLALKNLHYRCGSQATLANLTLRWHSKFALSPILANLTLRWHFKFAFSLRFYSKPCLCSTWLALKISILATVLQ